MKRVLLSFVFISTATASLADNCYFTEQGEYVCRADLDSRDRGDGNNGAPDNTDNQQRGPSVQDFENVRDEIVREELKPNVDMFCYNKCLRDGYGRPQCYEECRLQ